MSLAVNTGDGVNGGGAAWAERWLRATATPRLLVVGGASLDRIHVDGVPVATPGGAGLYTALAAARAGVEVTMLAPRPDPMPSELAPALGKIQWVGPRVDVDGLPRFEIAYRDGDVAHFEEYLGAEPDMTPALLDLIDDLPACAYCVPFMDAGLQRAFIAELRRRGCLTVAATYGKAARLESEVVRATFRLADLSFCNAAEAELLLDGSDEGAGARVGRDPAAPRVGALRFVTRGAAGVTVYQGDHRTDLVGERVDAVDPTGAGDTFCGTTVARILLGDHPVEAARRGNAAAAEMVTEIGPRALLRPGSSPHPTPDTRVAVDDRAVGRLAERIAGLGELDAFAFTGPLFPEVGDPGVPAWFAAATLQQFGFWYAEDGRWAGSMIAPIEGAERKGSDYLWAAYLRWARSDPTAMSAPRQAALTTDDWRTIVAADDDSDPFPDTAACVAMANAFGRTLLELEVTAESLVALAAASPRPMRSLLTLLDHIGGYREDPLRKKSALLGVILRQRPEGLLPRPAGSPGTTGDEAAVGIVDDAPPIVDYHVQRTALRTGLVRIVDASLERRIAGREVLDDADEWAVRRATAEAVAELSARSGRGMGTVDWFMFEMRHRCPEAVAPRCAECPADPVCAHRIDLFQPVRRTTAY